MTAPGRFRTIQSSPRWQLAQSLANGVLAALDGGDLTGARAAAAALLEFIERLEGAEAEAAADRGATGT